GELAERLVGVLVVALLLGLEGRLAPLLAAGGAVGGEQPEGGHPEHQRGGDDARSPFPEHIVTPGGKVDSSTERAIQTGRWIDVKRAQAHGLQRVGLRRRKQKRPRATRGAARGLPSPTPGYGRLLLEAGLVGRLRRDAHRSAGQRRCRQRRRLQG